MSSIVNKVKDALHSDKDDKHSHPHDTTGTHTSRVNEPRVDSEHDTRTSALNSGTAGNTAYTSNEHYATGVTGPASTTAGPHSSNMANKADPRIDSDLDSRNRTGAFNSGPGPASNTAGPHSSNMANKAEPRVDSDMDSHNRVGGTSSFATGPASNTAGPHSSNLANKGDPRVDSDLDRGTGYNTRSSAAAGGIGATGGAVGSHPVHGQQYDTTTGRTDMTGTGLTGTTGLNTTTGSGINTTTGTSGVGYGTGNTMGTHETTGLTGNHGTTTTGHHNTTTTGHHNASTLGGAGTNPVNPGPAPNTAGPHKSDMLNKADPRVDSNLDGSKTVGGNNTAETVRKDPMDASQVPPSVLQKHVGAPAIHHDDATHDRERRHSITQRETHSGL